MKLVQKTLQRIRNAATSAENDSGRNVLAISMPKCGTHLLTNLVANLTGCERSSTALRTANIGQATEIIDDHLLCAAKQGVYLRGHQIHDPDVEQILSNRQFRIVMILRDPRDTVVSHAHWVTSGNHKSVANCRFYESLNGINERIMASICGRPSGWNEGIVSSEESELLDYHGERDDIGRRLKRFLPWMDCETVCTVKFEDLVGDNGGGTKARQVEEIRRVAAHLQLTENEHDWDEIADNLFDPGAKTFRRGKIGGWRESLNDLHKIAFKSVAGRLLVDLGYETDFNW